MNPLESLAEQVPHLQHSFDSAFVFGSGSFGMTQYVLWMLICFLITLVVVLAASKRLTIIPTNKFTNMVEYGYEFVKKDMGESAIGHGRQPGPPRAVHLLSLIHISEPTRRS